MHYCLLQRKEGRNERRRRQRGGTDIGSIPFYDVWMYSFSSGCESYISKVLLLIFIAVTVPDMFEIEIRRYFITQLTFGH